MIVRRMEAEDEILKRQAVASELGEKGSPKKKRKKGSADVGKTESAEQKSQADVREVADVNLQEVAPILAFSEVRRQRAQKIRTESSRLLLEACDNKSIPSALMDFCNDANHRVFHNSVGNNPHESWVDRIAARCTGQNRLPFSCHSDCKAPDMRGIPPELPRVHPDDVIVTVMACTSSGGSGAKEQEFDILASQHLWELRDALWFVQDFMFDGPKRAKSACFFIDGIFYSDRRHRDAVDYSVELVDFLKKTREPGYLRKETSESMEVRLCDLERIPFGERCVYIHQGDIEHNIFFTGARLVGRADCPLREAYPVVTFMRKYKKKRCYACQQRAAVWLVLDSSRCPHNPCWMCAVCFRRFYQDADGKRFNAPVDYKVFPYLHDE